MRYLFTILCIWIWGINNLLAQNCDTPQNIKVNYVTQTGASVEWQATAGATRYRLEYRKTGDTRFRTLDVTRTNAIFRGLTANTSYEFRVKAACDTINAQPSLLYKFTTLLFAPVCSAPQNVRVSNISTKDAVVEWQALPNATGYVVEYRYTGYINYTTVRLGLVSSVKLSPLVPDQPYEVRVKTDCNGILSEPSTAVIFKTTLFEARCEQPRVIVNDVKTNSAQVSWDIDMSQYAFEYRKLNDGNWISELATAPPPRMIKNLLPNTQYEVRMRNFCTEQSSEYTQPYIFTTEDDSLLCPKPVLTYENLKSNSVIIAWTVNIPKFELSYKKNTDSEWTTYIVEQQTRDRLVENLTDNSTYTFRVRHFCNDKFSDYTYLTLVTPKINPCRTPVIQVSNVNENSAIISWDFNMGLYEVSYRNINSKKWIINYYSGASSRRFTNLPTNQTYELRMRNYCSNGLFGDYSNTVKFTTFKPAPNCPVQELKSVDVTYNTALISWNWTQQIEVEYKLAESSEWMQMLSDTLPTSYLFQNLNANATYQFRARNICNGLFSAYSEILTIQTLIDPNLCYQPFDFQVDKITDKTVVLSWNTPPTIIDYQIEYRETASDNWISFPFDKQYKSITLVALNPNTDHEVRIRTNCRTDEVSDWIAFPFRTLTMREANEASSYDITVYPNPGQDIIHFGNITSAVVVSWTDISGRKIKNTIIDVQNPYTSVSDLPAGIYNLEMLYDSKVIRTRWIKN